MTEPSRCLPLGKLHTAVWVAASAALCLSLVLLIAAPAAAAGPAVWSDPQPPPGSAVATANPLISVHVDDVNSIMETSAKLKLDGSAVRSTFAFDITYQGWIPDEWGEYWGTVYDYTAGTFTYQPSSLSAGIHQVEARIRTFAGTVSTYTWTFAYEPAPQLSVVSPAPGTTVQTQTPLIELDASGAIDSYGMSINGQPVSPQYDPATGSLSYAPDTPLVNGVDHTVEATVSNTFGQATETWSFHIQIFEGMEADSASCVECHPGNPEPNHPMADCDACHNSTNSPVGPWEGTAPPGTHPAYYLTDAGLDCADCHIPQYPLIPQHGDLDARHESDQDITDCQVCHESSLTIEHNRSDGGRTPYTCADCHASTNQVVRDAIDAGDSRCNTCHDFASHPGLGESHTSAIGGDALGGVTPTVLCGDCHFVELSAEHGRTSSVTQPAGCGACHPTPRDTITTWDKTCSQGGCHVTGTPQEMHAQLPAKHDIIAANQGCTPAGCHDAGGLSDIHAAASTVVGGATLQSCLVCHSTDVMPSNVCTDCHTDLDSPGHEAVPHDADLTPQLGTTGKTCADCHQVDVRDEHDRPTSSSAGTQCANCHPSPRDTLDPWTQGCVEGGCHVPGSATEMHAGVDAAHVPTGSSDGCTTSGCHDAGDVAVVHVNASTTGGLGETLTSCSVCHTSTTVPTTTDCTVCHGTDFGAIHPNIGAAHTAEESGSFNGRPCTQCHYLDIATEHGKSTSSTAAAGCAACHPDALGAITRPWSKRCIACHDGTIAPASHGSYAAVHQVPIDLRNNCATCHGASSMDTRLHPTCANVGPAPNGGLGGCHVGPAPANMPWTNDCRTCHPNE